MKKAICITTYDNYTYPVRTKYIEKILKDRGYSVEILSTDYDHRTKKYYVNTRSGLKMLHVRPYNKNISFQRIISHVEFAKKSLQYIDKVKPDLVFASGAPNIVYKYVAKYKKNITKIILIMDVTDMWPETFPISPVLKKLLFLPFYFWKKIRSNSLIYADYVLFECGLFENIVKMQNPDIIGSTVYLCEEDVPMKSSVNFYDEKIELLYLGSINNIIDIDLIELFIIKLLKFRKITLHVIGEGENKEVLYNKIRETGAEIVLYGALYDDKKLHIMQKCHFAFNVMKGSVCVGATMKSIEYFRGGIPILNNIKGDTEIFVAQNQCGYNFNHDNIESVINQLLGLSYDDFILMKKKSRQIYDVHFSPEAFYRKFNNILDKIEKH